MARVVVDVMLKPEILDPQGKAVHGALAPARLRRRRRRPPGQALRARVRGRRHRGAAGRGAQGGGDPAQQPGDRGLHGQGRRAVKIGVVTFPGSLDDVDARRAVEIAGGEAVALWHGDSRPAGRRRRRPARWLLLRRLPALRRDRPLRAGDDRGHRRGEERDADARHLQRLPDPVRGAPAARRA